VLQPVPTHNFGPLHVPWPILSDMMCTLVFVLCRWPAHALACAGHRQTARFAQHHSLRQLFETIRPTDRRLSAPQPAFMRCRCHRTTGIPSGRFIVTYAVFTYGNFTDAVNDDSTSSFHDFSRPPTLFIAPANVSK
jgi:hypothetical protein